MTTPKRSSYSTNSKMSISTNCERETRQFKSPTAPPSLTLPKFARTKNNTTTGLNDSGQVDQNIYPVHTVNPTLTPRRSPAIGIVPATISPNPELQLSSTLEVDSISPSNLRSPLYIPKIGLQPGTPAKFIGLAKGIPSTPSQILQPDENPWLPPKIEGSDEVKIAALTPIGTIAMVPTCDKRPPPTPRKLPPTPTRHLTLNVINEQTGETRIDPILKATIYLDCTKPEDQDYNYVSERMRKITANTATLQKQYSTNFHPLPNITGRVSYSAFEEALSIYENNQVYYQDRIDDKTLNISQIRTGLTNLEHWFACIIEPKASDDIESWRQRELSKLTKGVTSYCDPELYPYIQPIPPHMLTLIKQYQAAVL